MQGVRRQLGVWPATTVARAGVAPRNQLSSTDVTEARFPGETSWHFCPLLLREAWEHYQCELGSVCCVKLGAWMA